MSDINSTILAPLDARFHNLKVFSYKQWDDDNSPNKSRSAFVVEGDSFFDGRVNIGGRLTVAELDISGEDGGGVNIPGGSDGDVLVSDISSSMQWREAYWKTNDSPLNVNGPTDNIIYTTHKVGLGTTSVPENLNVSGNVKINDIYIGDSPFDSSSIISQYGTKSISEGYSIKIDPTTELSLNTSTNIKFNILDSEVAIVDQNGNFGIGITNPQANLHVAGNTIVDGNLTVNGSLTTVNSETVEIEDSMLFLAKGNNADNIDFGIVGQYIDGGITKYTGIFRDANGDTGYFNFFHNLEEKPTTTVNIGHTSYQNGNLHVGGLKVDSGVTFTTADAFIYSDDLTFNAAGITGSGYVGFNVTSSPTDAVDIQQGVVIRDGNLKIGITDSQASVHINRNDVIVIPAGDTSERLDITAAIRYNSDNTSFEGYNGTNWGTLGGVKDVDGDTYISAENSSGADNDELKFYTANNESMIIDSNGVVGINTVPTGTTYKLEMDGKIGITGSILPMVDRVFNLGSTSQRWGDLYFGGETIYLGDSVLKDYSGTLTITGPAQIDELSITQNVDIDGNLDVSGLAEINNINVTQDINISGSSYTYNLYVTHDANISGELSIYDLNVSNNANITSDLTISGNTNIIGAITASSINLSGSGDVSGDLNLSGDVNIGGDAQMNTISVTGDADIDGNLDVSGTLIMNNLYVTNDATIGNNLLVTGNTDLQGNLDVSGLAQIQSLNVSSDVDIDGNLDVSGTLIMNNLYVTNDATIGNNLLVTGNTDLQGNLDVSGLAQIQSLNVSSDIDIDGNLDVAGIAKLNTLNVTGNTDIDGNLDISGSLTIDHDITIGNNLLVTGNTDLQGNLDVSGLAQIQSLNVSSDVDVNGNLDIAGIAQLNTLNVTGNTDIDGNLDISGSLTIDHDITIGNNLLITGNTDLQGNLDVSGLAQIQSLNVTSDVDVDGNLDVSGSLTMNFLNVTYDATIGNDLYVTGNSILQGNLDVTGNTNLKGILNISGQTTINNNLNVTGNAGINSLNVTNDARIAGNFIVDGDMTVHGTTTTINTETLAVEDPIIKLGSNNNTSDIVDLGYYGKYVNTDVTYYSGLVRDATDGIFKFYNTQTEPTTIVDFNDVTLEYSDVKMDDLDANNVDVNNVNISNNLHVTNNANINTLNVTGNADIDGTIDVQGAANLQSTLAVGGDADLNGALDVAGTAQLNALNVTANADVDGTLNVQGAATMQSSLDVQGTAQLNAVNVTGNADIDGNLDVSGTLIMNNLYVTNDATIRNNLLITGNTDLQGNLDISGLAQIQSLNVSSDVDVNGNLDIAGIAQLNAVNVTGNADIDGTINIEGETTIQSSLEVQGTAQLNALNVTNDTNILGNLIVDSNTELNGTLDVQDSVSIQSTAQINALNVTGNADIDGTLDVAGTAQLNSLNVTGNADINGTLDVAGTGYINELNITNNLNVLLNTTLGGDLRVDTDVLVVDSTNDRIGINNSSPDVSLHISGTDAIVIPVGDTSERIDVTGAIRYNSEIQSFEGYSGTWGSLGGVKDVDGDTYISPENSPGSDNDDLKFYNGGNQTMIINSNGDIGIGVSTPTNKLEIEGDVSIYDFLGIGVQTINYPLHVESTNNNNWSTKIVNNNATLYSLHTNGNALNIHSGISSSTNYLMKLKNNSYSEIFNVLNNGNVGINTGIPSKKLEINTSNLEDGAIIGSAFIGNDVSITGSMFISNNTLKANSNDYAIKQNVNGQTDINSKTGQDLYLNINNNPYLTIKSDGKVGIHTISPNEDIEFADNVLINSTENVSLTVTNTLSDIYMAQPDGSGIFVQSGTTQNYALKLQENNNDLFIVYNNGNVSIGTTQGDNKLTVESGLSIMEGGEQLNIHVTNTDNIIQSDNHLLINISSNDILDIKKDNITVNGDLNVTGSQYIAEQLLINTTSSAYQLEVSGDTRLNGDVVITGILSFEGVSVDSFEFQDSLIKFGNNNTDNTEDIGFYGKYIESGTTKYTGLFSDASNDNTFILFKDLENDPTTTVNINHASFTYGDLILNDIDSLGKIAIGTTDAQVSLHISGTDAIVIPVGDTSERVDITGAIRYNNETQQFEGYSGTWGSLGGVIDVDQDTYISAEDTAGLDNDQLKFFTAGNQRLVIDSNGYFGIGITNPLTSLHISSSNTLVIPVGNITQRIDVTGGIRYNSDTISFEGYDGSNWGSLGGVKDVDQDTYISAENSPGSDNDELKFFTANNQHMIIDSTGKVGIGITNPQYALDVDGIIQSNDEMLAPEFTATCDIRVKENIKRLDDKFLEKLCNLNLFEYNYTNDYSKNNEKMYGLLAQNVEKVIPEAIKTKKVKIQDKNIDDFKTISQNTLITYLIGSMQQLTKHHNNLANQFLKLQTDYIELKKDYDLKRELDSYKKN